MRLKGADNIKRFIVGPLCVDAASLLCYRSKTLAYTEGTFLSFMYLFLYEIYEYLHFILLNHSTFQLSLTMKICHIAIMGFYAQLQKRSYYIILYGICLPGVCQVRVAVARRL